MEDIPPTSAATRSSVLRTLITAQTTNAIGEGGFLVTSALYFSHVIGLSPTEIGVGLTIAWGLGFLAATPLGQLADRVGLRRAAVTLAILTALALCLVTLPRTMLLFVLVASLYAVAQSALGAVRQALLVTLVEPTARVLARGQLQVAVNAGIGVGAALGGVALSLNTPAAYVAVLLFDAATFLVSAVLLSRLPDVPTSAASATASPLAPGRMLAVLRDRPYVAAAALVAVLYLYMPLLSVVLPLYIVEHTSAPTWTVAAVFILSAAGVVAFQVRAARTVTGLPSAVVAIRRAGFVLLVACLIFAATSYITSPTIAVIVLALAMGFQVLGEVFLASGAWEIGFSLADPDRQGQWQGLFSSGIPLARAVGPLAITSLLLTWSGPVWSGVGWLVLGLIFLTAALLLRPVVAWAARSREPHLETPQPTTMKATS